MMMDAAPFLYRLDRDRVVSLVAVAMIHLALGYALLTGLGVSIHDKASEVLAAFDVTDPPPPPPESPRQPLRPRTERAPLKEGAAAPPNLKSRATEVIVPDTPVPIPPPLVVATQSGAGADATSGNAERPGPGTGSGGIGTGTGSGRFGDGPGGGGDGGRPVRLIRSGLGDIGCPTPEIGCPTRIVGIRFRVDPDGRAHDCVVTGPSGDPRLDSETCRRIEQRLRYDPARDRTGRKIAQTVTGTHEWEEQIAEPDRIEERRVERRRLF